MRSTLILIAASIFVLACGSGSRRQPTGPLDPGFTISASTLRTRLGRTGYMPISITSTGYSGPLTFSTSGVPAEWTITPPSVIQLTASQTVDTSVAVALEPTGPWVFGGDTLTITGSGSDGTRQAKAAIELQPVDLNIDLGTGGGAHWGRWRDTTIYVPLSMSIVITNNDTVGHHIVITGVVPSLVPSSFGMAPGNFRTMFISSLGAFTLICDSHPDTIGVVSIDAEAPLVSN